MFVPEEILLIFFKRKTMFFIIKQNNNNEVKKYAQVYAKMTINYRKEIKKIHKEKLKLIK